MDWLTLLCYSAPLGALTAAVCVIHSRVSFLEDRLMKLAEAGVYLANGLRITAETQSAIVDLIRGQIKQNESTTT